MVAFSGDKTGSKLSANAPMKMNAINITIINAVKNSKRFSLVNILQIDFLFDPRAQYIAISSDREFIFQNKTPNNVDKKQTRTIVITI